MSDWQDIATAPKDGSHVLVCAPNWHRAMVYTWRSYPREGKWLWSDSIELDDYADYASEQPTLWMPLPTPPETT